MEKQFPFSFVSILDNDFYKFTMQCAVIKLYPNVKTQYQFINRGKHAFPDGFGDELRKHVNSMAKLQLTKQEKIFLAEKCPYLNQAYIDFLGGYHYDPSEVEIIQNGSELEVKVQGYWYRTILWEIPLLSLISELFYKFNHLQRISDEEVKEKTREKMNLYEKWGVTVAEFGTRRRHSYQVHRIVMQTLMEYYDHRGFVGTSNVHLAMLHNTRIIGTHAHEWFMFHGARYGYKVANAFSLKSWIKVYQGDLGIALTDTYTTEVFFRQFNKKYAKLFDGVRHDSGDPIVFANKTIAHYKSMNINPLFKTIIFSDALNPEKVQLITEACKDKIGISFGIGTNLTNDVGLTPMNIVMKLTAVAMPDMHWTPTVKLSDEHGKYTGDIRTIELAKEILGIA
ncbi:MAG: nicotinate phosphoribosyltransferase [Pseudopedobacter saltans]|uniref:Nicotinate phosphoribosyltransferase n=1 Tax=Pseudopedobacter saltans TaxID=151895 RepID=A0A2W5H1H0_9SPHI|nr:MAG: nicotinate phosphoribosyltransferase [Pseudopedobacter saltans]